MEGAEALKQARSRHASGARKGTESKEEKGVNKGPFNPSLIWDTIHAIGTILVPVAWKRKTTKKGADMYLSAS